MITQDLEHSLAEFHYELGLGYRNDYVIFGSASLSIRGIIDRYIDDVDVFVPRYVWASLFIRSHNWTVKTPNAGDPPLLNYSKSFHELNVFYDWSDPYVKIDPKSLLKRAEYIDGYRLAPIEDVLRQKKEAYNKLDLFPSVAKHLPDIQAIERYLAR